MSTDLITGHTIYRISSNECRPLINIEDIDKELTHKWLQSSCLQAEIEGLLIAAQDRRVARRNYQHKIIKNGTSPKFRLCHEFDESIEHITSGYAVLARKEYLERRS